MNFAPLLVGFGVGLIVGLTSIGAGALLTPALIYGLGVPPALAVGTDVFIATIIKLLGGGTYAIRRAVDWRTAGWLAAGSLPGAAIGLHYINRVDPATLDILLRRWLGGALLLGGAAILAGVLIRRPERPAGTPRVLPTIVMGFITGLLVGMTSIGSGSLLTAMLVLFSPLEASRVVGTDMIHALALSAFTAAGHAAKGRINFALAGAVLLGAAPGVLLGARLATRVHARALRAALAVALLLVGGGLLSGKLGKPKVVTAPVAAAAPAVPGMILSETTSDPKPRKLKLDCTRHTKSESQILINCNVDPDVRVIINEEEVEVRNGKVEKLIGIKPAQSPICTIRAFDQHGNEETMMMLRGTTFQ